MPVSDYDPIFQAAAQEWDIDPLILKAVAQHESGGNPRAVSKAGAVGLMQIMPGTAKTLGVTDTTDPAQSIYGAAKYLSQLSDHFKNPAHALAAYDAGQKRVDDHIAGGGPLPTETQAYVPAVAAQYQKLAKATAPAAPNDSTPTVTVTAPKPAATAQKPAAAAASDVPSDEDFLKRTSTISAPKVEDDADFLARTGAKVTAPGAPVAASATPPAVPIADPVLTNNPDMPPAAAQPVQLTPGQQTAVSAGTSGLVRGVRDFIDPAAAFLARNVGPYVGAPTAGADITAGNTADRNSFDQSYGGNPLASVGRVAGQTLATIPTMAAVNPLIAGAGEVAGAAIPVVGNALRYGAGVLNGPAAGVGGNLLQTGARVAQGGALGGEAAALTSGQSDQPIGQQIAQGAVTGGVLGAAAPLAINAAVGVGNALTGGAPVVSREVAQLAQLARERYGIQIKAPQLGLSPTLSYANNALKMVPGSGAGAENAVVQSQFNGAVARTINPAATVTKITPEFLSAEQARIGGTMNRIENGANVALDDRFVQRAADIESAAESSLTTPEYGVVKRQLDNVLKNLEPGDTISGTTYGNLIHKGSPLDAALNSSDSNIRNYAGQIREALRDSLTRSLSAEDAQAYQQARTQYKNLKTVQPLTLRADAVGGAAPSTGDVSPAALRMAVNRSFGDGVAQAAPGEVPLNDLARIGQMLKEPPSSGTAERTSILYAASRLAELGGAAAAGHYAGLVPAAAGVGAGIVGGRLAGAYLRSNWLANRLIGAGVRGAPLVSNPVGAQFQPYIGPLGVLGTNPLQATPR